jgi:hypothetical protein
MSIHQIKLFANNNKLVRIAIANIFNKIFIKCHLHQHFSNKQHKIITSIHTKIEVIYQIKITYQSIKKSIKSK